MSIINESSIQTTFEYIQNRIPEEFKSVKLGIICGTGLGSLVDTIDPSTKVELHYTDIPGFAVSKVLGHASKLVFGHLGEARTPTVFMVGRFHFYEGHSMQQCTLPVRVMKLLGVETLIVTNAAGSLNKKQKVGDLMILQDHIFLPGLVGSHPLVGHNLETFGTRFPSMSDAYSYHLRRLAFKAGHQVGIDLADMHEGVYCMVSGPSFETSAESCLLMNNGADAVGMSTVPEVVVARHCGIQVLGISLMTNAVVISRGKNAKKEVLSDLGLPFDHIVDEDIDRDAVVANHEEVLETGAARALDMQRLVKKIADLLSEQ
ncbi:purine nucleoside phosphorylase [Halteromyces radiatus]|uniref:purine nucleoside phosphorylase n=1 Tax=Halteromyces radiatus TaxID=101107 RepID=UPI002220A0B0|nr:purine nucleoside phosphorylase [Halteromyces radiatus]KAI8085098.1 purine nucleoside phosphorylase [Halteromyces radiatus]